MTTALTTVPMEPASNARVTLRARLLMMLIGWGAVGVGYNEGQFPLFAAHVIHENRLDRLIAFTPWAVWLYLSFFLLVPCGYLLAEPKRVKWLAWAMVMAAVVGGVVFLLWPTTLVYPSVPFGDVGSVALAWLAGFDTPENCLPSLHATLVLLSVMALWRRGRFWRNAFFLSWGLLVMASVILTRRHLSLDVMAGVVLGMGCAWFAGRRVPKCVGLDSDGENAK